MNKKRILSAILAAALTLGSTTAFAQENGAQPETENVAAAAETVYSAGGTYSDGVLTYSELDDGTYKVSGVEAKQTLTIANIPEKVNGKKVTSIGLYAFSSCEGLTSVAIPSSVTSIGEGAFSSCNGLTSVTIPGSVTSIGLGAFSWCKGLTSVTILNGAASIGQSAFSSCTSLESVTIPNSVTSIGKWAFDYCISLKSVTIPGSVRNIEQEAFSGCSGLTEVTLSYGIINIGEAAFYFCEQLTDISIPESVVSIGKGAFMHCSSLVSVTIPNGVTSIEERAFGWCQKLGSVTIPASVTYIGEGAFEDTINVKEIIVDKNNKAYCSFDGVLFNKDKTQLVQYPAGNKNRTNYTIPSSVERICAYAFNMSVLTAVEIPNSVKSIGSNAFNGCHSLLSVTIPDSVTSIGSGAFSQSSITSVVIPDSVTSISEQAFCICRLVSVKIPNSITTIDKYVFSNCSRLTSVVIPNSVTDIGEGAFGMCKALKDVYYDGTEVDWKKITVKVENDPLLNATIHYNSTGPSGTPLEVAIKAPTGVDTSNQTVTVTVNGETKTLPIVDGLLDVSALEPGTYTFTFSAKNCAPRAYSNITVANGTATGLDKVELNLYGDINVDGKINASDVLKAKLQAKGSQKLSAYDFAVADVTKDGKVNSTDILKLKLHAKGSTKLW